MQIVPRSLSWLGPGVDGRHEQDQLSFCDVKVEDIVESFPSS